MAQFSYNLQKSFATGYTPFELVNGQMLVAPHIVLLGGFGKSPHSKRFLTAWEEALELAHIHLHYAAGRMNKLAHKDRRDVHFDVEDKFFLRITEDQIQPPKGTSRSLTRRSEGPFQIKKQVGEFTYELDLSNHIHSRHHVFHMSHLKECRLHDDHPKRTAPPRGPAMIVDRLNLVLEKIHDLHTSGVEGAPRWNFLVQWRKALETKDSL